MTATQDLVDALTEVADHHDQSCPERELWGRLADHVAGETPAPEVGPVNEPHPLISLLAAERRALRVSQQAVADACGLERHTVSDWEVGRRTPLLTNLAAYARVVGMALAVDGRNVDGPAAVVAAIREHRTAAGMSQFHLSIEANLEQATVSLMETGRKSPVVTTVERCLRVLGLELGVARTVVMEVAA